MFMPFLKVSGCLLNVGGKGNLVSELPEKLLKKIVTVNSDSVTGA